MCDSFNDERTYKEVQGKLFSSFTEFRSYSKKKMNDQSEKRLNLHWIGETLGLLEFMNQENKRSHKGRKIFRCNKKIKYLEEIDKI